MTQKELLLNRSDKIGDREYDRCGEMGDGEEVAFLVMHTLASNKIFFEMLPLRTQRYFGLDAWENWKRAYMEKSTM